jgi:hypothetical protein
LVGQVKLPDVAGVPEENEVLVHRDALEIVDVIVIIVEIYEFWVLFFFFRFIWISLVLDGLPKLAATKAMFTSSPSVLDFRIWKEVEKGFLLALSFLLFVFKFSMMISSL